MSATGSLSTSDVNARGVQSADAPRSDRPRPGRVAFIDDLRGVAVVLMVLWHSADAWIVRSLHEGATWGTLRLVGGMAAPLFIFLAGTGVALKVAADRAKYPAGQATAYSTRALVSRGFGIFVLGYGLRLQMWLVDSGAVITVDAWRAWIPWLAALVLLYLAADRYGRSLPVGWWVVGGVASFALAYWQMRLVAAHREPELMRVDVLQCIGLGIVLLATLGPRLGVYDHAWRALAIAVVLLFVTEPVTSRMTLPLPLPEGLMAYVARWPTPPDALVVALFPQLPWLGYAFAGAALGTYLSAAADRDELAKRLFRLAVAGAVLALVSRESWQPVHRLLEHVPMFTIPARAAFRLGLALVAAALLFVTLDRFRSTPLRILGSASLVVYWVHLTFTYGLLGLLLRSRLDYSAWVGAFVVLVVVMWVLAWVRVRVARSGVRILGR